jgi:hypothetical protein
MNYESYFRAFAGSMCKHSLEDFPGMSDMSDEVRERL